MPSRRHTDPLALPRVPALAHLALPGLIVAFALAVAAAVLSGAAQVALLAASLLLAAPSAVAALTRDRQLRRRPAQTPRPGHAEAWASGGAVTGATDASGWEAALQCAGSDPRAAPLSAIRLRIDAPGLAGSDRDQELARLQTIATVSWREILRPADTLAQVGPSEFAVLLPRCEGAAAEMIAGRLQHAVPEAARCRAGVATSARGDAPKLAADAGKALAAASRRRDALSDPARLATVRAIRSVVAAGRSGSRDPELDALAHSTTTLLGVDALVVTLVDDRLLHLAGAHGLDALDGHEDGLPVQLTLCRHAVAGGRPVLVSDTARHGIEDAAQAELRLGISACASVPVNVDGVVVGTVCALRRERYEWTGDDTAVLRVAADRAERHLTATMQASREALFGLSLDPG